MLKKENRLTKDKEFDRVFKNGRTFYDEIIGIRALSNERQCNRLGILINNKVSKKAVERNRIRRQIRQIAGGQCKQIKTGYDIVVIVLPRAVGKQYQALEKTVIRGFKKLGLVE